jgi:hypothetical protein
MKTLSQNGPGWTLIKLSSLGFLALMALCLFPNISFAQTGTFEITSKGNVSDIKLYEDAMNSANFDSYRFQTKRRMINFEAGVLIELLSAEEVESKGLEINKSLALNDSEFFNQKNSSSWRLTSSGHIIESLAITPTK